MNENDKYRVLLYGMLLASFQRYINAKEFVQNSREDGFMVTLWELDGKNLRHVEVPNARV